MSRCNLFTSENGKQFACINIVGRVAVYDLEGNLKATAGSQACSIETQVHCCWEVKFQVTPESNRLLQDFMPLTADQGQDFSLSFGMCESKDMQQNVCRQCLNGAWFCLHTACVCLKDASALFGASTPLNVLVQAFTHFGIASSCIHKGCLQHESVLQQLVLSTPVRQESSSQCQS